MHNRDLVSVIIPCFNQAKFLGEAVESVLAQTYRNYEIIVVDDGSTDATAKIAASFDGARCLRQRNLGLAAARNAGFAACNGDYLVFLDADDRLLPNALHAGVSALELTPECAFVYGHVNPISSDGSTLPIPVQVAVRERHYLELLRRNYIWTTGAVMYRRRVIESVGAFDLSAQGSADFDLNIRIARVFPISCCDTPVLEYRRHPDSMSHNYALMLKSAIAVRRNHGRLVKGNESSEVALEAGIRGVQQDYGEKLLDEVGKFLRDAEWRRAMSGLMILIRCYPHGLVSRARTRLNNFVPDFQG